MAQIIPIYFFTVTNELIFHKIIFFSHLIFVTLHPIFGKLLEMFSRRHKKIIV